MDPRLQWYRRMRTAAPLVLALFCVLEASTLVACTFGDTTSDYLGANSKKKRTSSSTGDDAEDETESAGTSPDGTTATPGNTPTTPGTRTTSGSFDLMLDKGTATADMNTTQTFTVMVVPQNGFSGTVNLTASGLPANATGTFDKPSVDVSGSAGVAARLTVVLKTNTPPGAASIKVSGAAGTAAKDVPIALTVSPRIQIPIKMNATQSSYVDTQQIRVATGGGQVQFVFVNQDSSGHIIHANPHGDTNNPIQANGGLEARTRTISKGQNFQFYLHDLNQPANQAVIIGE